MYAERFDPLGIRLYITKIRDGDDGIYTCKARISDTGEMLEQETKMFLYGNCAVLIVCILRSLFLSLACTFNMLAFNVLNVLLKHTWLLLLFTVIIIII